MKSHEGFPKEPDTLAQLTSSPVVELNRAVAVVMAYGPQAGLDIVDTLLAEPTLRRYHLLSSVRVDFHARLIHMDEARVEYKRAAALTHSREERALLLQRAAGCTTRSWHGRSSDHYFDLYADCDILEAALQQIAHSKASGIRLSI